MTHTRHVPSHLLTASEIDHYTQAGRFEVNVCGQGIAILTVGEWRELIRVRHEQIGRLEGIRK